MSDLNETEARLEEADRLYKVARTLREAAIRDPEVEAALDVLIRKIHQIEEICCEAGKIEGDEGFTGTKSEGSVFAGQVAATLYQEVDENFDWCPLCGG